MYIKKGFTLAEILIVMVVIGVIAVMTVPGLIQSATETQYKSAYKKAYKSITDITTLLGATGRLPIATGEGSAAANADRMFWSLNENLNVKNYAPATVSSGAIVKNSAITSNVTFGDPYKSETLNATAPSAGDRYWINTEDGMSYTVINAGTTCSDKKVISSKESHTDAVAEACSVVVVDVNGITNLPNTVNATEVATTAEHLTGDQYYIYVGNNGISAGAQSKMISARIISDADLKVETE